MCQLIALMAALFLVMGCTKKKEPAQHTESMPAKLLTAEAKQLIEKDLANPVKVKLEASRLIFGDKNAPITIVKWGDFLCEHCGRAYYTMKLLVNDKYKGKVKMLYKHMPFKPWARDSALYYEALNVDNPAKAEKFYNMLYQDQKAFLKEAQKGPPGEDYLKMKLESLGYNFTELKKKIESEPINAIVDADMNEARSVGVYGTPAFAINGVRVYGEFDASEYSYVIDKLLEKK